MTKLLLLPWSFAADYCLPLEIDSGSKPILCLVQDTNLASFGILIGMVIVARALKCDETPSDNSFCIIRIGETRYLKRVSFKDGLQLSDDSGAENFSQEEVFFQAVALYACSCDLRGSSCVPVPLSVEGGLAIFRQRAGMIHWETDESGHLKMSDEMREWLVLGGGKPEEWEGWGWGDFLHPEDGAAFIARWRESLETGGPYLNQGRIYFAGAWLHMGVSANPLRDESGRIIGWAGFVHFEAVESRMRA